MSVVRKKINELSTLYLLEPELRDIYVEGKRDKNLIDWFLFVKQARNTMVYTIDDVEVSDSILHKYGLQTGSNRSKVIALSAELLESSRQGSKIMCIADRDFGDYLSEPPLNPNLYFTDHNSMELYAFNEKTLRKLLTVVLGGFPLEVDDLMSKIGDVLEKIYVIRLANESLGWKMEWLSFDKYVSITGRQLLFKTDQFKKAYLLNNKRGGLESIFDAKMRELETSLKPEVCRKIRGHDFTKLLLLFINRLKKRCKFGNLETFEGSLFGVVESGELDRTQLFQTISAFSTS